MTALVSTIEIDRTPDEVFHYVSDPTRFPEWQDDIVSVHMEDRHPLTVGARFTTVRRIAGGKQTMTQTVTESSSPRTWSVQGVEGPIRPTSTVTVESLPDRPGSRVTFTLEFEGHGVGVPLVPLVRKMAASAAPRSYQNLKRRLESGGSPE